MHDYIIFMHNDVPPGATVNTDAWTGYLARLRESGGFQGGGSIGDGLCLSRGPTQPRVTRHITGYIKIRADSLEHAQGMVPGNPVFEAGGTVEIRELPRD
jgi:hypothetical protein